jgi:hypothetical protein
MTDEIGAVFVPPSEGESAGGDVARGAIATADIEADHATMHARGIP